MAEASEKSFPFDAEEINGEYDRTYLADDFAAYFRKFITSGIFMKVPTNLQVVANEDMTVTLKSGDMIIYGHGYQNEADIVIPISPADGVLNRIDRIAITWDKKERENHFTIREGEYSYEPVAPICRRNAEYKDYVVADIYVKAGAIEITQAAITDQRLNSEVCGLATPFIELDLSTYAAQIQNFNEIIMQEVRNWQKEQAAETDNWQQSETEALTTWIEVLKSNNTELLKGIVDRLTEFKENTELEHNDWYNTTTANFEAQVNAWFENLKAQLTDNVAINLQNQIGNLADLETVERDNLVSAVNEVKAEEVKNAAELKESLIKAVDEIMKTENAQRITVEKYALCAPTAEGNILIENVFGQTAQKNYIGKNMFQHTAKNITRSGVTFSVNADRSISAKGTASVERVYYVVGTFQPTVGESYIFSSNKEVFDDKGFWNKYCYYSGIDGSSTWYSDNKEYTPISKFTASTSATITCGIFIEKGQSVDATYYPMFRPATIEDDTYEPYVGGIASPNIDYPQELESVGDCGNVTITTRGKNLIDLSLEKLHFGYPLGAIGETIDLTGTTKHTCHTDKFPAEPGTYTLSEMRGYNLRAYFLDENDTLLKTMEIVHHSPGTSLMKTTAIAPEGTAYALVSLSTYSWQEFSEISSILSQYDSPQLERGEYTPYTPYTETNITIPLSEPLRSVSGLRDEICVRDGVYGILRRTVQEVLDGSTDEKWALMDNGHIRGTGMATKSPQYNAMEISNMFRKSYSSTFGTMKRGEILVAEYLLEVYPTRDFTVAEWRTFLAAHPLKIIYGARHFTFEPFSDQSIFYNLKAGGGITDITISSDSDSLTPTAVMRVPRNRDGALSTTAYAGLQKTAIELGDMGSLLDKVNRKVV